MFLSMISAFSWMLTKTLFTFGYVSAILMLLELLQLKTILRLVLLLLSITINTTRKGFE